MGAEGCDDGNSETNDGCDASCALEAGFICAGTPSSCAAICGDGVIVGVEGCDDGGTVSGDGCDAACAIEAGYDCSGTPSLCAVVCGDGLVMAQEGCDDANIMNGDGCDAVCAIEVGYSCAGTPSICTAGCGDGVVAGSEGCDNANGTSGDGCSSACQVEAGFMCSGSPSTCCLPEVEPNGTYSTASGPVPLGLLSCGSLSPIGDVDYFSFTLATAGDVRIETFDGSGSGSCIAVDTLIRLYAPDGQTLITFSDDTGIGDCSRIDGFTDAAAAALPPGIYHVLVNEYADDTSVPAYTLLIDATVCGDAVLEGSEQCDGGASCGSACGVTTAGVGESWQTAEPFPGCPTTPGSAARLGVPDCFPHQGAVHWYSHVAADGLLKISADAAAPVALFDGNGQMIDCTADASARPLATVSQLGATYHVAVTAPTAITCLTIDDLPYSGLSGALTDLGITFPLSATSELGMAASATDIYLSTPARIFAFPKSGNATAVVHGSADGITTAHLGQDIHFLGGSLFSLESTINVSASRLFKIHDSATGAWAPTAWDTSPSYSADSPSVAMTSDGATLFYVTRGDSGQVHFYSHPTSSPAQPEQLGTITGFSLASGVAVDALHFYVAAQGPSGLGVYRLLRADLSAVPTKIGTLYNLFGSDVHTSVVVDDTTSAEHLYVRDRFGDIRVIIDPGGQALDAGVLTTLGTDGDISMTYDTFSGAIYFFETESDPAGRVVQMQ